MKKLSNFLAEQLMGGAIFPDGMKDKLQDQIANQISEGLEAYKVHLQTDQPKTAGWAMREKEMISALDRMESTTHNIICMCHPHEVRMNSGEDKCPTCNRKPNEKSK